MESGPSRPLHALFLKLRKLKLPVAVLSRSGAGGLIIRKKRNSFHRILPFAVSAPARKELWMAPGRSLRRAPDSAAWLQSQPSPNLRRQWA